MLSQYTRRGNQDTLYHPLRDNCCHRYSDATGAPGRFEYTRDGLDRWERFRRDCESLEEEGRLTDLEFPNASQTSEGVDVDERLSDDGRSSEGTDVEWTLYDGLSETRSEGRQALSSGGHTVDDRTLVDAGASASGQTQQTPFDFVYRGDGPNGQVGYGESGREQRVSQYRCDREEGEGDLGKSGQP